jgi:CheY-like chemotaxis protein
MPNIRLLMIEDDPDVAELLLTYFDMVKYEVYHGADGREGIALARAHHPNLILLDVMLPDMSGWDIAKSLRGAALTRYIPIIFLTQRAERGSKIKGLALGADDYVTKPFDVEELRLRVQAAIRRATRDRLYEPRTGLPGTPLIKAEMEKRDGEGGWSRLDLHIDGLGAFRDVYGFLAGDEALGYAAQTILKTVRELGTEHDFVGIDDDDTLVVITHTPNVQTFRRTVTEHFRESVRALYNFQDAERGYILMSPGTPEEAQAPLMSLSFMD